MKIGEKQENGRIRWYWKLLGHKAQTITHPDFSDTGMKRGRILQNYSLLQSITEDLI